ncbi:MAG: hypothetical protein ACTSWC_11600 [Promethearchaeota archaeon]
MAEQPPSKFPAQNSNSENQKTRKMNSEQVKEKEESTPEKSKIHYPNGYIARIP